VPDRDLKRTAELGWGQLANESNCRRLAIQSPAAECRGDRGHVICALLAVHSQRL
jgi:hypothetical protein